MFSTSKDTSREDTLKTFSKNNMIYTPPPDVTLPLLPSWVGATTPTTPQTSGASSTTTTTTTTDLAPTSNESNWNHFITFVSLLLPYCQLFTFWKSASPKPTYDPLVPLDNDNDPFATGMKWSDIQTELLKLWPKDLVQFVNNSANAEDLKQNMEIARKKSLEALPKITDYTDGDVQQAMMDLMKKIQAINENFTMLTGTYDKIISTPSTQANPIMNCNEWNNYWNYDEKMWESDIFTGISELFTSKVFVPSLINKLFVTMVPSVWGVTKKIDVTERYNAHMLDIGVKPPSDEYYDHLNEHHLIEIMRWFHAVKLGTAAGAVNGVVTMRGWYQQFVREMNNDAQNKSFKVDKKDVLALFNPPKGAVEIGCYKNVYKDHEWDEKIKKSNATFSMLPCMKHMLSPDGMKAFNTCEDEDAIKDVFDALNALFMTGTVVQPKSKGRNKSPEAVLKFVKSSVQAEGVLTCCTHLYEESSPSKPKAPARGKATTPKKRKATAGNAKKRKATANGNAGNAKNATPKRKKSKSKSKSKKVINLVDDKVDDKSEGVDLVDDKSEGALFRMEKTATEWIQHIIAADKYKEHGSDIIYSNDVYSACGFASGADIGLTSGSNFSRYQTGKYPNLRYMYREEEQDNSEGEESSDNDESSDEEDEEINPYKEKITSTCYLYDIDNLPKKNVNGYWSKDDEGVLSDTLCISDERHKKPENEELFDKMEWTKKLDSMVSDDDITEEWLPFVCRADKNKYVFVERINK